MALGPELFRHCLSGGFMKADQEREETHEYNQVQCCNNLDDATDIGRCHRNGDRGRDADNSKCSKEVGEPGPIWCIKYRDRKHDAKDQTENCQYRSYHVSPFDEFEDIERRLQTGQYYY